MQTVSEQIFPHGIKSNSHVGVYAGHEAADGSGKETYQGTEKRNVDRLITGGLRVFQSAIDVMQ